MKAELQLLTSKHKLAISRLLETMDDTFQDPARTAQYLHSTSRCTSRKCVKGACDVPVSCFSSPSPWGGTLPEKGGLAGTGDEGPPALKPVKAGFRLPVADSLYSPLLTPRGMANRTPSLLVYPLPRSTLNLPEHLVSKPSMIMIFDKRKP